MKSYKTLCIENEVLAMNKNLLQLENRKLKDKLRVFDKALDEAIKTTPFDELRWKIFINRLSNESEEEQYYEET